MYIYKYIHIYIYIHIYTLYIIYTTYNIYNTYIQDKRCKDFKSGRICVAANMHY